MEAPDPIRRAALTHAAQLLIEVVGAGAPLAPVEESIAGGGVVVRVFVVAHQQPSADPAPGHQQAVSSEHADDVRRVLAAAAEPLKITTIARRAHKDPPTSHFRAVVYAMRDQGELRRVGRERYWLASRPLQQQ